jgi:hypothetical protein
MSASGSPTVRRRRLAAELRRLRGRRTGMEVAHGIGWSPTKISRAESGRGSIPPHEIAKLIDYYGVTGPLRAQLLSLAEDAVRQGWWEDYADVLAPEYSEFIGLEAEAASVLSCHFEVVPGLLQTEEYARQISLGYQRVIPVLPSEVEQVVRIRMIRQERLVREPVLHLSAIIDESVLLRNMGGPAVMRAQLEHLALMSEQFNVEIRVLPFNRNISLAVASFLVLRFGSRDAPASAGLGDVVSTESLRSDLCIEGEGDTYKYRLVHRAIADASLSPDESRHFITNVAKDRY